MAEEPRAGTPDSFLASLVLVSPFFLAVVPTISVIRALDVLEISTSTYIIEYAKGFII